MAFKFGSNDLAAAYRGGSAVDKFYLGSTDLGRASSGGSSFPSAAFTAAGGFLNFSADNTGNNAVAFAQAFLASDIDTSANTITLPASGFGVFGTYTAAKGTRGWFGSSGAMFTCSNATLVAGTASVPGTFVYRTDVGAGKAKFYVRAEDTDYAVIAGAVNGETVRGAEKFANLVELDITAAGTGPYTFYTWPLTSSVLNVSGAAYTADASDPADPNTKLEVATDSAGRKYFVSEKTVSDPAQNGSYRGYGKGYNCGPLALRDELQGETALKRWVWHIEIIKGDIVRERVHPKTFITSGTGVDTSTDIITNAGHPFATANQVRFQAYPGSSYPGSAANAFDNVVYVRVATNDLTFHPTAGDASGNTNKIDITSVGANFIIYAPQRVGDGKRWGFPMEHRSPDGSGGNVLSTRSAEESNVLTIVTAFDSTGTDAGDITGLALEGAFVDGTPVQFFVPIGSVMPTCADTGLALAGNTKFWMTTVSGKVRLHRTLQGAMESVGVATVLSSCIKFTVAGSGECNAFIDDGTMYWSADQERSGLAAFVQRVPCAQPVAVLTLVDYDNAGATGVLVSMGINTVTLETIDLTGEAKGLTQALNSPYSPATFMNSPQGHVAFDGGVYRLLAGAGTGAPPTTDLQTLLTYFISLDTLTIAAPVASVAPTIPNSPGAGVKQIGTIATWTGSAPFAYSFQWYNATDNIGTGSAAIVGATSFKYTPIAGDIGKFLRRAEINTNLGGAIPAYSNWSSNAVVVTGAAEAAALNARMTTPMSAPHLQLADNFYAAIKTAGINTKLDGFYCFAVDTPQSTQEALLNWMQSNTAAITGGVTLTAKAGVTGNGTTGYIDTGINPSTAGGQYAQNSAAMGVKVTTNQQSTGRAISIAAASTRSYLLVRSTSDTMTTLFNMSAGTITVSSVTDARGISSVIRTASNALTVRKNKALATTPSTQVSAGLSNGTIRFMNDSGAAFFNGQIAAGWFGSQLSSTENDALEDAVNTLIAGIAAL